MIRLTKEMIDRIFEPRRDLGRSGPPLNRVLSDSKGNLFCVVKRGGDYHWLHPSRSEPGYALEYGERRYRKGTWPVWEDVSSLAMVPTALYEVLPGPTHQAQILEAFYRIAFPDWDSIVKIDGWPRVSKVTWTYIWEKFSAFDKRMHPDVLPAGAWALGSGFSGGERADDIPDWIIDLSPATAVYKWTPFRCSICRTDNEYEGHRWSRWSNYIEWDVWLARGEGEKWRMNEAIDPSHEKRPESLEEAMDMCAARAGCLLKFTEVPPHNEHISAEWQSEWVRPQKEEQRVA